MIQFCLIAVVAFFALFFFVAAKFNKQVGMTTTDKFAKQFHPVPAH